MWDKPINLFEKVKNPTETDDTEDEKNELVILDDADNWFPVSLSILHFSQNKDLGIRAHTRISAHTWIRAPLDRTSKKKLGPGP